MCHANTIFKIKLLRMLDSRLMSIHYLFYIFKGISIAPNIYLLLHPILVLILHPYFDKISCKAVAVIVLFLNKTPKTVVFDIIFSFFYLNTKLCFLCIVFCCKAQNTIQYNTIQWNYGFAMFWKNISACNIYH